MESGSRGMEPLLSLGDTGEWVSHLQGRLVDLGVDPGPADGTFGNRTQDAVVCVQDQYGLAADGVVGPATWSVIDAEPARNMAELAIVETPPEFEAPPVLETPPDIETPPETSYPALWLGQSGEWVSYLQELLASAGCPSGAIDGVFGQQTDSAVRGYQQSRGLAADGVVGNVTWAALAGRPGDVGGGGADPGTDSVLDKYFDDYGGGRDDPTKGPAPATDRTTQERSWVEPHNPPSGVNSFHKPVPPKVIIGQIFFPTNVTTLDGQDCEELDKINSAYLPELNTHAVGFEFHGFADRRHTPEHNAKLAQDRADTVLAYVKDRFFGHANFQSVALSHGVDPDAQFGGTAQDLAAFRRVDIHAVPARVFKTAPPDVPPEMPRSRNFEVQINGSGSVTPPIEIGFIFETVALTIQDTTNRLGMTFVYEGKGAGLGTSSFGLDDTAFVPIVTSRPVALQEFSGPAMHICLIAAAGAGITADRLELDGPKMWRDARTSAAVWPISAGAGRQAGLGFSGTSGTLKASGGVFEF
jgi:peptidoglycan hydrolase-like protein with peptidoglycan-binding domain